MSRRFGNVGASRRGARRLSDDKRSSAPPPPLPPLPAAGAGDLWHADYGLSPAAWVSRILGNTLAGVGAPVVAIDPGFFNDTIAAQTTQTGDNWINNAIAIAITAPGDRPYACGTWRHRTAATGTQDRMILAYRGGAAGTEGQVRTGLDSDGAGNDFFMARRQNGFSGATAASGDIQDTAAHFWEIYSDATLGTLLYMDGVLIASDASATGQAAFASAITMVAFGCSWTGDPAVAANGSSASGKWFLIWDQEPTGPERAALLAYSQTNYATP